jgi:hypothetical protein
MFFEHTVETFLQHPLLKQTECKILKIKIRMRAEANISISYQIKKVIQCHRRPINKTFKNITRIALSKPLELIPNFSKMSEEFHFDLFSFGHTLSLDAKLLNTMSVVLDAYLR